MKLNDRELTATQAGLCLLQAYLEWEKCLPGTDEDQAPEPLTVEEIDELSCRIDSEDKA